MQTQEKINPTKMMNIAGQPAVQLPNQTLLLPKLGLSFAGRGSDKGNAVRNSLLAYLLPKESIWDTDAKELLAEYAGNQCSITQKWFEHWNWDINPDPKPEEKSVSWLLRQNPSGSSEYIKPLNWLDFWEKLIVKGFSPSILEQGFALGFPSHTPNLGKGVVLTTVDKGWKYLWTEDNTSGEVKMKTLIGRGWTHAEPATQYEAILEDGWQDEPILSDVPVYQLQIQDARRGWLDDWSFHTLKRAKSYIKEHQLDEKPAGLRVINVTSQLVLNLSD